MSKYIKLEDAINKYAKEVAEVAYEVHGYGDGNPVKEYFDIAREYYSYLSTIDIDSPQSEWIEHMNDGKFVNVNEREEYNNTKQKGRKRGTSMSYGAELLEEMHIADAIRYAENEKNIAEGIWTMRDGNKINIKDMSREHLRNTIAMLERGNSPFADEWIARMTAELDFRKYIDKIVVGEL